MTHDNQVRVLNRRSYYDGDVIFHEGDTGSQAFVVQQGRVRIVRAVEGGEKATLGIIEAGGIFGEMALIDKSTRMASAIADGTCVCISIPEETVRKKLKACDPVVRTVILMMIRMIRTVADETRLPPDTVDALTRGAAEETAP